MNGRRVVVTGLGSINPIGKNVEETWNGIKNKVCGIDVMKLVNPETFKTKMDAEVKEYNAQDYFDEYCEKLLEYDKTSSQKLTFNDFLEWTANYIRTNKGKFKKE